MKILLHKNQFFITILKPQRILETIVWEACSIYVSTLRFYIILSTTIKR